MRFRLVGVAVVVGVVGWVVANAFLATPRPARAQTSVLEIRRAQRAGYLPRPPRNRPIVLLAIGSDARPGNRVDRMHADSIHLIAVNPRKGAATILGFPRDSYVSIPGRGTSKINDSMVYGGPPLVVKTVESITGIRIDYWMLTSFKDFIRMVDGIGGMKMTIHYPMHDHFSGTNFDPGMRKLRGRHALAFARDRHSAPGGDFGRSFNQGRLILAALKRFRDGFERDPTVLFKWLRIGLVRVSTDLGLGELIDLGLLAAQVNPNKVRNMVLPGSTGMAGAASVVHLSPSAQAIYRDVKRDGILNR